MITPVSAFAAVPNLRALHKGSSFRTGTIALKAPPPVYDESAEETIARLQWALEKTNEALRKSEGAKKVYKQPEWWRQGSQELEDRRAERRDIFMHDDWVKHRSSNRFFRNMKTLGSTALTKALVRELIFVSAGDSEAEGVGVGEDEAGRGRERVKVG